METAAAAASTCFPLMKMCISKLIMSQMSFIVSVEEAKRLTRKDHTMIHILNDNDNDNDKKLEMLCFFIECNNCWQFLNILQS